MHFGRFATARVITCSASSGSSSRTASAPAVIPAWHTCAQLLEAEIHHCPSASDGFSPFSTIASRIILRCSSLIRL